MNVSENAVSVTVPSCTDEIARRRGVPETMTGGEPCAVVRAVVAVLGVPDVVAEVVVVIVADSVPGAGVSVLPGAARPPGLVR